MALRSRITRAISIFWAAFMALFAPQLFAQSFNYGEALQKSLFFYEAQRSGDLPATNRVNWRGDSGMQDGSDVGRDLTGGWYDAGDHVKFGLPMAASATMLAWGIVDYRSAYVSTGQLDTRARPVEVGHRLLHQGASDRERAVRTGRQRRHRITPGGVRPKSCRWRGPSYRVTTSCPGSDLAGETAAAMAAASIAFRPDESHLREHAALARAPALHASRTPIRGKYSDCITDASGFYNSWSGYNDELVWGAIWMYRATNEAAFLDKAQSYYANLSNQQQTTIKSYKWTHAWDDKSYGSYVLLAKLTGATQYHHDAQRWLNWWTVGGTALGADGTRVNYSPGGQAVLDQWGSLRYAANTAFAALVYSDAITDATLKTRYHDFAKRQIDYALGAESAEPQLRRGLRRQSAAQSAPSHRAQLVDGSAHLPGREPSRALRRAGRRALVAERRRLLRRRPQQLRQQRSGHRLQRRLHRRGRAPRAGIRRRAARELPASRKRWSATKCSSRRPSTPRARTSPRSRCW